MPHSLPPTVAVAVAIAVAVAVAIAIAVAPSILAIITFHCRRVAVAPSIATLTVALLLHCPSPFITVSVESPPHRRVALKRVATANALPC